MKGPLPSQIKDVLVHTCFAQEMGDPQPSRCLCRKRITGAEAVQAIARGEAEWLAQFSPTGSWKNSAAVVKARERRTPKAATIDARHIERAYVDGDEQAAIRIEEYGLLTLELRALWVVPFRSEPDE